VGGDPGPLIISVGVISLAVPGSNTFAGEFMILAGVFQQGWGWAIPGLVAMVLGSDVHAAAGLGAAASRGRRGGAEEAPDVRLPSCV